MLYMYISRCACALLLMDRKLSPGTEEILHTPTQNTNTNTKVEGTSTTHPPVYNFLCCNMPPQPHTQTHIRTDPSTCYGKTRRVLFAGIKDRDKVVQLDLNSFYVCFFRNFNTNVTVNVLVNCKCNRNCKDFIANTAVETMYTKTKLYLNRCAYIHSLNIGRN